MNGENRREEAAWREAGVRVRIRVWVCISAVFLPLSNAESRRMQTGTRAEERKVGDQPWWGPMKQASSGNSRPEEPLPGLGHLTSEPSWSYPISPLQSMRYRSTWSSSPRTLSTPPLICLLIKRWRGACLPSPDRQPPPSFSPACLLSLSLSLPES